MSENLFREESNVCHHPNHYKSFHQNSVWIENGGISLLGVERIVSSILCPVWKQGWTITYDLCPPFLSTLCCPNVPKAASLKFNSCLSTNTTEVYGFRFEFCVFAIQTSISTTPCLLCQIHTVKKLSCGHILFAILIWLQMFLHSPEAGRVSFTLGFHLPFQLVFVSGRHLSELVAHPSYDCKLAFSLVLSLN